MPTISPQPLLDNAIREARRNFLFHFRAARQYTLAGAATQLAAGTFRATQWLHFTLNGLRVLENLCREFPENRFLVSVLSRENQHELCVYARKFSNLMPFGCWWFLNNPSIVEEITRERIEMLGTSFIPQHSDARVFEQIIYKWSNTRRALAHILSERYVLLLEDGRSLTRGDIRRDVTRFLHSNAKAWAGQRAPVSDPPTQTL
ncbi:MAG TPA: hypothetical protein VIW93_01060 [Candidatus Acidoferrum sp.]